MVDMADAGGQVIDADGANEQRGVTVRRREPSFLSQRERWQAQYLRDLRISDTAVVCLALAAADGIRFGLLGLSRELSWTGMSGVDYSLVGVTIGIIWLLLLALVDSRSRRILGRGGEEYRRVMQATTLLFCAIAFLTLGLRMDPARGYIALALPLGIFGLLLNRWVWRQVARRRRRSGKYQTSLLVVGSPAAAADVASKFVSDPSLGFAVIGLCTPQGPGIVDAIRVGAVDVPVVGVDKEVVEAVLECGADTVAISPTDFLSPAEIRKLIWELDGLGVDLIVSVGLVDVAAERIDSQPIAGMALLLIEKPQYDHANSWAKRAFDLCFATLALIGISPVLLAAAIAVKVTSRGPVFYRAERIGVNGNPFAMLKFRSMADGADKHLSRLIDESGADPLFFKIKDDPRVTPVGKILRKFSIDELPQFINVLKGDMSVVGPRPQVLREVQAYDDLMRRRLLVRPGVTGLWQVSGRSDLTLEYATRLDLAYVENWSMARDLVIVARTVWVVLTGHGAY